MFQYFVNTSDADVEKYIKLFTFHSQERISEVMKKHKETPEKRSAQTFLADTVLKMLYFNENMGKGNEKTSTQDIAKKFFETDFSELVNF